MIVITSLIITRTYHPFMNSRRSAWQTWRLYFSKKKFTNLYWQAFRCFVTAHLRWKICTDTPV